MIRHRAVVLPAALALVVAGCIGADEIDDIEVVPSELPSAARQTEPAARSTPLGEVDVTWVDCDPALEAPEGTRCSFLVVPEDRGDPSGPVVEIAVAVLPATGDDPAGTPLVVLPDGPGGAALPTLGDWVDDPLREDRDIVLLDPRGTGRSFPSLTCPGADGGRDGLLAACRTRLAGEGVDLSDYDTAAAAADVADLAHALGFGEYNLLGTGWGARLAMTVLRDHPAGLRAVVLDSVPPPEVDAWNEVPLNAQSAVNRVVDACAQQDPCLAAFPDVASTFATAVRGLDLAPYQPEDGSDPTSGADLVALVLTALADAEGPRVVPLAMSLIGHGEVAQAVELLEDAAPTGPLPPPVGGGHGAYHSMLCRDEAPFNNAEVARGAGSAGVIGEAVAEQVVALFAACATWGAGEADAVEDQPISGRLPVLFLNGEFDPFTPSVWAGLAASRIDGAQVVEVPGTGHGVRTATPCVEELVRGFLRVPTRTVDDTCVVEAAPVEFRLG